MIKIIVMAFVFGACIYISKLMTKSLNTRVIVLDAFYRDVCLLKDLALLQSKDICAIFDVLSKENIFFKKAYVYIYEKVKSEPNLRINEIWASSLKIHVENNIDSADFKIISDFSNVLTFLRNIGINEIMSKYMTELSAYIKVNKKQITDRISVINKCGYIVGAFLVIIMI